MDWEKWEKSKAAATGFTKPCKPEQNTQMRVVGKPDFDQQRKFHPSEF